MPPVRRIASSVDAAINRRAFPMRARRSSFVIGVARFRIDGSAAIDAGSVSVAF
ncbi:MAG: hypothetical protein QM736_20700 [Vicinamibacterales bacterium]